MSASVLRIENLSVNYNPSKGIHAVYDVAFTLKPAESVGLIGESGSGKSSLALALMGLVQDKAKVGGVIQYGNSRLDRLREAEWGAYRWSRIAIVFQNSLDVFNPVMTIAEQISECIKRHTALCSGEIRERTASLLAMSGLDPDWGKAYPHQLSGGMRQKALIAMALSCDPEVLIVDEPTMALDAVAKAEILALLQRLQAEKHFSLLVISHELPVIAQLTSRIMVMYSGNILEEGPTQDVLKNPQHPYTRGLINASPAINPFRDMWGIPGETRTAQEDMCPFSGRCNQEITACRSCHPLLQEVGPDRKVACLRGGIITLLQGSGLYKTYRVKGRAIEACHNCSIQVRAGEVAALIGESGSGKTSLAEILAGFLTADRGEVLFEGRQISGNSETARKGGMQIVFQDPTTAINERFTVEEAVREPLDILRDTTMEQRRLAVRTALRHAHLPYDDEFLAGRCFALSGGQRQRVALARSLVMEPKLLIADEISAMLDPSTGANILRLLKGLQNQYGFAMLYITHDLALAQKIADKIYVMRHGVIIEHGAVGDVFFNPHHDYTKDLLRHAGIAQPCPH